MKTIKNMRTIETVILIVIIINLLIWGNEYWEKIDLFYFIVGILSILVAYFLVFLFLRILMDSFAEKILQKTVEYFSENYKTEKIGFSNSFYQERSREYTCYILLALILLDGFALYKFNFSVLSIVNTFINSGSSIE
jgi:hypothetical protein